MKLYKLEFLGYEMLGQIIVSAKNENEARHLIEHKIFSEFGAAKAFEIIAWIDNMVEHKIEESGYVYFYNGEA